MNLDLSETQLLLQRSLADYLARELPLDRVRALEREGRADDVLWKSLAEQGFLALPFDEGLGGAGGSLVDAGILIEALARRAALVPVLEVLAAGRVLQDFAAGELLSGLLAGEARPVPALLEAGERLDEVGMAVAAGRLSGEKRFVDHARFATHHLVSARAAGEPALFLVDASQPGVSCRPLRSIGRSPVCHVRYEGAPARRVAGAEGLAQLVRLGRLFCAVQCLGSMQEALDMTVAYAGVRKQFGRAIGSFQAVRHHCANMAMRVASTRLLVYEALSALDAGSATDRGIALAKASASQAAPEVTMLAHQIHGGNGVIEENDLYFFTLRAKERSLAWGTAEECLAEVAGFVHEPVEWL